MNYIKVTDNRNVYADGIHDDTKGLQACIDAVKDGGTVYFPDGIYLVSAALIFYSNQHLKFSDKAVILRSDKSEPVTRYLLASYSEPDWGGYTGTHNVVISGGVFDGNININEKSTLINTVHCSNIRIENCRFLHCSQWHFIEINSTENAVIDNCVFDGASYTSFNENLLNELVQLDLARNGSYGPVYNCDGMLIDFKYDDTVCRNVKICNCIFKCAGFPAIGHHGDCAHHNVEICCNIFDGPSGRIGKSRGYIIFRPEVYDIRITDNFFAAPDKSDSPNLGVIIENNNTETLIQSDNVFKGHFDEKFILGSVNR